MRPRMRPRLYWLVLVLVLTAGSAHALCLRGRPETGVAAEYRDAQFVLVARAEERRIVIDPIEDPDGYEGELYRVDVEQLYKGRLPNGKRPSELWLHTPNTSARLAMSVGERYLQFVLSDESGHWVSSCGHSVELDEAGPLLHALGLGLPDTLGSEATRPADAD